MPKSKIPKKRLFRDFALQDKTYVKRNYLKNLKVIKRGFNKKLDIDFSKVEFLMWGYDLQFFTIDHASEALGISKDNFSTRYIYPLVNKGYLYKHFDRLTPSSKLEDHLFRDETKYNYRVRYAITQRSRLLVQKVYRELEA